jgi:hypothetical protein
MHRVTYIDIHICTHTYIHEPAYLCRVAGDHIRHLLGVTMGVVTPLQAVILHITRGGTIRGGTGSKVTEGGEVTNIVSLSLCVCVLMFACMYV